MLKKIVRASLLLAIVAAVAAWFFFFSSATQFEGDSTVVYIYPGKTDRAAVLQALTKTGALGSTTSFEWLADARNYFNKVKPGKYRVKQGASVWSIYRMLANGRQEEVKLVLGKMRLPEDFAGRISKLIYQDSATVAAFISSEDSLRPFGVSPATIMTALTQNTYRIYWTSSIGGLFKKLAAGTEQWWQQNDRKAKAEQLGFSPAEVYIIASIVEEETNKAADKPLVASVYINRLRKGMPLQADPTIRYARKDFISNQVTYNQLKTVSPYNTYLNKGLPPGPICIPSLATLDAVLEAPATNYLYFVAKADLSGGSVFNADYNAHLKAADEYQDSLQAWLARKAAKKANP